MLDRRSFLATAATLPLAGRFISMDPRPPGDNHVLFWFYFRAAVNPGRALSTEQARKAVIADLKFENTSKQEALLVLEQAAGGVLGLNDMPPQWREYFNKVEREYNLRDHYQDREHRNRHAAATEQVLRMFDRYDE
jgi:hypothetical protein